MSYKAEKWAWEQSLGLTSRKFVLISLCRRLNDKTGRCDPAVSTIADDTEMSKRACNKALKWLEENQFIKRHVRMDGRKFTSNQYEILMTNSGQNSPSDDQNSTEPDSVPDDALLNTMQGGTEQDAVPVLNEVHRGTEPDAHKQGIEQGTEHIGRTSEKPVATIPEPDLFKTDPQEPEPAPPPETKPKAKSKRGTRLPENWAPSEADVEYARNLGMSDAEITDAAEEFRNYWIDVPGQRGVKLTWSGTFRNRCRAVVARAGSQAGRNRGTGQLSPVQACRELLHENREKRRLAAGAATPTPAQAADWPDDHKLRTIEGEATRVRDARVVALRPRSGGDAAGQFGEQDPYPVFQSR